MTGYSIYNRSNVAICEVKKLEYHGQLMNGRWLTVDVESPTMVALEAGCYITFNGVKYSIRNQADVEKSARPSSHGGAFVYKDIRFEDVSWQALEDTQMCDYVYDDNHLHYSGLGTFSFYVTKASDIGFRVLANLRNKYGTGAGVWSVKIDGYSIRGSYTDYTFEESKSISISSGTSLKEVLDMLWAEWGVYYTVGVRTVNIVTASGTGLGLKYGKGYGLKSITRKINPNVEICTRVRAYGSERNMPYRWYNNKYGNQSNPTDPLNSMYIPQLMLPHEIYYDANGSYLNGDNEIYTSEPSGGGTLELWNTPSDIVLPSKTNDIIDKYGMRDKEIHWNSDDMGEIFPSMKGMTTTNAGVTSNTYNDGGELDRLLQTDGQYQNARNEDGTAITGYGNTDELTSGKINFKVRVPNPGFNPIEQKGSEDVVLLMQSGKCQARGFTILSATAVEDNDNTVAYDLICVKSIDDEIDQVFPNATYTIKAGDYYVYTGLAFINEYSTLDSGWLAKYIAAAEKRLLRAAALWLREHQTEQYVYEIQLDNIYLKTNNTTLTEGDRIALSQDDFDNSTETIETLTVNYGKDAIPTYEVSFLRMDETESLGDRVKGLVGQTISVDSDIAKMNDQLYRKVNKTGFHTLFDPLDESYNVLDINGDLSALKYIRANVDFFSTKGVSALGVSAAGGGGGGGDTLLAPLTLINGIGNPSSNGTYGLTWNGTGYTWTSVSGGGGGGDYLPLTGGTLTGALTMAGRNIYMGTTDSNSNSTGDIVFVYGNGQEKARIWMDTAFSSALGPQYRCYKNDGTLLISTRLVMESQVNNGYSNKPFGLIPRISSGGVMEVGNSLEFHYDNTTGSDYSVRIYAQGNNSNSLALPTTNGTLATQEWVTSNDANNYLTGVSGSGNGTMTFTRQGLSSLTFNSSHTHGNYVSTVTPDSASVGQVVTYGTISGNTLTLSRSTLSSIINTAGYKWWGRTMTSAGVVKGTMEYVRNIEFGDIGSTAGDGGYLDFHFNGSTDNYTSRIIEDASGRLRINNMLFVLNEARVGINQTAPNTNSRLDVNGAIRFGSGTYGNFLTMNGSYAEMASDGNKLIVSYKASSQGTMYINYRGSSLSGYVAPNAWVLRAGTSSSYASWTAGNMNAIGSLTVGTSTTDITNYIQIGGARLYWDNGSNSLYVKKADGSACNFYSLGGISALGVTQGSGGLDELTLGQLKVSGSGVTSGVLFQDDDGVSQIYSSGGILYINCEDTLTISGKLDMSAHEINNIGQVSTSLLKVGSSGSVVKKIYWDGTYLQVMIGSTTYKFRPDQTS